MRRFNIALLAIIVAVGVPWYWLLVDNRPGDIAAKPLAIAELRALADSNGDDRPVAISYEEVARTLRMRNLPTAGLGFRPEWLGFHAYAVQYADGSTIVIDSAMSAAQADGLEFARYDDAAAARVANALGDARLFVALGADWLHSGLATALRASDKVPAAQTERFSPAPGIAIVPLDGLPTGSQLVYVRLANGREYLFAGAVARLEASWKELRAPARVVTDFTEPKADRREIYAWLRSLHNLEKAVPGLVIVPWHQIPLGSGIAARFAENSDSPKPGGNQ